MSPDNGVELFLDRDPEAAPRDTANRSPVLGLLRIAATSSLDRTHLPRGYLSSHHRSLRNVLGQAIDETTQLAGPAARGGAEDRPGKEV